MTVVWILIAVIVFVAIVLLAMSIKIVKQYERACWSGSAGCAGSASPG